MGVRQRGAKRRRRTPGSFWSCQVPHREEEPAGDVRVVSIARLARLRRAVPAPPGETLMIESARSPRPHKKSRAALTLAGPGVIAAGFALPRDAGRRPVASSPGGGPLSRAILSLTACGETQAAQFSRWGLERRCIPAEPRRFAAFCVAFRSKYTRYSSLTRLVSRALPRSRRSPGFHYRLLRGTRREGSDPDGWGQRRRGPAGRCADRRSAFPCRRAALPDGVRTERCAITELGSTPSRSAPAGGPGVNTGVAGPAALPLPTGAV